MVIAPHTVVSLHNHQAVAAALYHSISYEVHVEIDDRRKVKRSEGAVLHS